LSAKFLFRCKRHILSIPDVIFVLSARYFLLTDNHYQQHNALQSRNCALLGRNLHKTILQTTIFSFWYIILIAISFHCSTVNFNLNHMIFQLRSYVDTFNHIWILVLTTLRMVTWSTETCWWPLCNTFTSMETKFICWYFNVFYVY
jgi:hypothetical protein